MSDSKRYTWHPQDPNEAVLEPYSQSPAHNATLQFASDCLNGLAYTKFQRTGRISQDSECFVVRCPGLLRAAIVRQLLEVVNQAVLGPLGKRAEPQDRTSYRLLSASLFSTIPINSPAGIFSALARLNMVLSDGPFSARSKADMWLRSVSASWASVSWVNPCCARRS